MPGSRMIEKWIRADLEWVLAQPEELFVHALSPEVGVPDPRWDDDCDQDRCGNCDPRLPALGRYFAGGCQRRNLRQHRQLRRIQQVLLVPNAIIQELRTYSEHERQAQPNAQSGKRKLEAVRKRRLLRQAGRIDDPE